MTDPAATTDELRGRLTAGCDLSGNHRHRPAAGGAGRPPRLTRVHAAALLARAGAEVVAVHADGRIEITTAAAFAATGRGHLGLARSELLDAGAHWCARTARWAPGAGPGVDAVLAAANAELAAAWHH
ncbi:hypothetical protein [Nocardia farcinica]|uniref:hypothetical protein n=1 Tax=Nocardia farcinica TaxID=37329 RepID=UPI0024549B7B|nr:hypothetical protein [Nocardia farcinica]